jgi:NRAMP (natural resistance-associated macrophage protein)-like metal ion transporter
MAEVAIIGSDIQEVIGSAIAISLLSNGSIPLWAGVLTTAVTAFILLFVERWGYRALESLFGGLIGIMVVAFAVMYAKAGVPALEVLEGFALPRLPRAAIPQAVALVGSLIMPHNIYLHSALVQTRRLHASSASTKREALTYFGLESAIALFIAVLINLFVIAVFAAGFYGSGADDIGLATAGLHLGERFGGFVVYIWALGLLAAGQSSTMTGTYTGQFVMAGFLDLQINPWLVSDAAFKSSSQDDTDPAVVLAACGCCS